MSGRRNRALKASLCAILGLVAVEQWQIRRARKTRRAQQLALANGGANEEAEKRAFAYLKVPKVRRREQGWRRPIRDENAALRKLLHMKAAS